MTDVTATETVSRLRLEVPVDAPMRAVIDTERDFLGVVGEVGQEVSEQSSDPVRWLLAGATTNGVIQLQLRGVVSSTKVAVTVVPQIVRAVTVGLASMESEAARPQFFNDRALELSQDIAERSTDIGPTRIVNGTVSTLLTPQGVGEHVRKLLGATYSDYGAVEGRLEGIIVHGDRYFNVYDALTGRRIRCFFGSRIPVKRIADALERRVAVYGQINYRSNGDVATVLADTLEVFPHREELPSVDDVRGILG